MRGERARTAAALLALPLLAALASGGVLALGLIDLSAAAPPGRLEERLARFALDRSVRRHAAPGPNPLRRSPDAARAGLLLYREHCVFCHGAPGRDPSQEGAGLNPPAPGLTLPRIQQRSDGELAWIVARGIRMTGMPAFEGSRSPEEIWQLVAALRRLLALTAEEKALLSTARAPAR